MGGWGGRGGEVTPPLLSNGGLGWRMGFVDAGVHSACVGPSPVPTPSLLATQAGQEGWRQGAVEPYWPALCHGPPSVWPVAFPAPGARRCCLPAAASCARTPSALRPAPCMPAHAQVQVGVTDEATGRTVVYDAVLAGSDTAHDLAVLQVGGGF